jgi:hypothetical protein
MNLPKTDHPYSSCQYERVLDAKYLQLLPGVNPTVNGQMPIVHK